MNGDSFKEWYDSLPIFPVTQREVVCAIALQELMSVGDDLLDVVRDAIVAEHAEVFPPVRTIDITVDNPFGDELTLSCGLCGVFYSGKTPETIGELDNLTRMEMDKHMKSEHAEEVLR